MICALPLVVHGQLATPKYSNEFMNLGAGASFMAVGQAGSSAVDDAEAGYWNPAGLVRMESDYQIGLMHAAYFAGIANYDYATIAAKLDTSSAIGLSVIRFAVDNIPDTRALFDANGSIHYDRIQMFSAQDFGFLLTYARKSSLLGGISLGANAKVIYRKAGVFSQAIGFGIDMGTQKQLGQWQLGVTGKDIFGTFNAWSHNPEELREIFQLTGNDVPINTLEVTLPRLILGISRKITLPKQIILMPLLDLDVTFDGKRNTLLRSNFASLDPHGGVSIGYRDLIFVRLGVSQFQQFERLSGTKRWSFLPSGGIGINVGEINIDYAMTDIGDRAQGLYTHVFSVKARLYAKEK
ncbi:MAG: hypothetical protein JXQ90_16325 [Cyclobacteriaceae bacterium]